MEGLTDNFDALHKLLGDDDFQRLCLEFIDTHPPSHFSIRWYGQGLVDFLRATAPYRDHPYLAELADFQWRLRGAFDAPDAEPVTMEVVGALAAADWPQMRLRFHPSLSMAAFEWDVPKIWKQLNAGAGDAVDEPHRVRPAVDWVVWRRGLENYFRSARADEAAALRAALAEQTFAEICGVLCEFHEEDQVAIYAAGLLKRWIEDEMLTGIAAGSPE